MPRLYWVNNLVEGNLAIVPAPRPENPLDEALLAWKDEGVDIVVSLVEDVEMPGLLAAERDLCRELDLEFIWFPVRDKTAPPSSDAVFELATRLAKEMSAGKSAAIHCRAGIGRSAVLAACVLVCLGIEAAVALDMIAEARGAEVPETEGQRQWVLGFGQARGSNPARLR
jgi:protein-tyrosine phosphatase